MTLFHQPQPYELTNGLSKIGICLFLCLFAAFASFSHAQQPGNAPQNDFILNSPSSRALAALDILPIGEKSIGVVLPDYDLQGNLISILKAHSAKRISETEIFLDAMTLSVSQDPPRSNLLVELPAARYDVSTSMLFGLRDVRVSRDDFLLTGDSLEFDTQTRCGVLRGNIRMVLQKQHPPSADIP